MSHNIIRSITVGKDNKVYFNCASSNVFPRTFQRVEEPFYSNIYQQRGLRPLLAEIAKEVKQGNFVLKPGTKICDKLLNAYSILFNASTPLMRFLDDDRAADFMAKTAYNSLTNQPSTVPNDLAALEKLRWDKEAVLEVCKKNPAAFGYAAEPIQKDRDTAMEYIKTFGNLLNSRIPSYFQNDRELVELLLQKNGARYHAIDFNSPLAYDKDLIRLAFQEDLPGRRFHEHLAHMLPPSILQDTPFMCELIQICPSMHVTTTHSLMANKDFVKAWFKHGNWIPNSLDGFSCPELLKVPELQQVLADRFGSDPEACERIKASLLIHGINWSASTLKQEVIQDEYEQAFSLDNGKYFLSIQTGDGYYDYTIYNSDHSEYDGGQLDEPDMTISEATEDILAGFGMDKLPREPIDYDELQAAVEEYDAAQRESLMSSIQRAQAKIQQTGPAPVTRQPGKEFEK